MKQFYPVIIILLFFFGCASSLREQQIDRIFSQWNKSDSPGCTLFIIHHGQLVYRHNYGMAELESQAPISNNTVFYIASMSKQFTAMSILLLMEQGKLSLNDSIQKYIPEFPNYGHSIMIQHLIHHTSGIQDYLQLWLKAGKSYADLASINEQNSLELLAKQSSLNFTPGGRYEYSNSNYFLLGIVVKRVSGKSLREFAAENIFRPLGMNNTQYRDDQNVVIPNLATGHILNANHELVSLATAYHLVGDGGIYTTAEDLFRWDQNFYNNKLGNKDRHLTDQFYEKGRLNNGDTVDYAFGVVRSQLEGMETIEHGGQFIGYKSDLIRFPAKELSVIVLCNTETIDAQRLSVQVANLYLTKE